MRILLILLFGITLGCKTNDVQQSYLGDVLNKSSSRIISDLSIHMAMHESEDVLIERGFNITDSDHKKNRLEAKKKCSYGFCLVEMYFYPHQNGIRVNLNTQIPRNWGGGYISNEILDALIKGFTMRSIIILFLMTFAACAVEIEYITIETIGSGSTRKDARMDAISEAIGQVTGRMIETTEQLSSHFQTKTDNDISQSSGVENYDKEINSATRGAVKSYTVLDEKETAYGWESKISAVVAKALPSKQSNRKKIAVMPFSSSSKLTFDRMALDALTKSLENRFGLKYNKTNPMQFMAMILTENIEAYLIQTRRFAVLDRVTSEVQMERNFVKSYSSSVEDLIKINQDSATELIVVGRLDEVSFNERVQRLSIRQRNKSRGRNSSY